MAVQERKNITALLEEKGYGCVILPAQAVPNGAVETYQDAQKCARLFQEHRDDIDGVVVVLPNFGDEQGVTCALDLAKLNVPVLVQACDDTNDVLGLATRRDAFCGKLSLCHNLSEYGIPFTNTRLHTCKINSTEFAEDLARFAGICRVVRGLRGARIGAIGARPEPFHTVRFSEKLFQASGIKVVTVDLSEILAAARQLEDTARAVRDKIALIKAYGKIPAEVPEESVLRQAKLGVALDEWMEAHECVASAIQCWTSVQQNHGCAMCLPMSMMGEAGRPSACEMDVAGAVSMYALNLASGGRPSGFVDWNNNYNGDRNKCIVTHCSNYPISFMGSDVEIGTLDVLGKSLGRERCFGAVKGMIAAGDLTYLRVSTDDTHGRIKSYVGQGRFTGETINMHGGIGVCEIPRLQELLDHLCQNGFEHHVAMTRGRHAEILAEAFGKYLCWDVYHHGA